MDLLIPGTGNQSANRKKATRYIADNIIDARAVDESSGKITSTDGISYQVSAYAETTAAFISTPKVDKAKYSIYASGLPALMFRQLKDRKRSVIYEVDPNMIAMKPNTKTAEWSEIGRVAARTWVCTKEQISLTERSPKS